MARTKIAPFYTNYEIVERNYENLDWFIALFSPASVVEVITLVFVLRHSIVLADIFFTGHGDHNNLVYFVYGRYSLILIVILHENNFIRSAF